MTIFNFDSKQVYHVRVIRPIMVEFVVSFGVHSPNVCIWLDLSMPTEKSGVLVDNIDAISIVPMNKAIEMAKYGTRIPSGTSG